MDRITLPLHGYIIETNLGVLDFGDLDPIFKVTRGLKYVKISLKLIYHLNLWLDSHQTSRTIPLGQSKEYFSDLDPIFKVNSQLIIN